MIEPLQEAFFQRALLETTLLAIAGGALGCWIVLFGLSYAAESLSHALFPGLVLAAIAGAPLLLGAAPAVVLAALAIALVARVPGIDREVGIAVVVTTMFGAGVLLALSPSSPPGVESLLFGDILGPSDSDLISAAVLVALLLPALALLHPRLLATGFDPGSARGLGIAPGAVEAALLVLVAAAVVVAVQGFGNLLVVAAFVGPAAAARNLTARIGPMLMLAVTIGVLAGIAGLYVSYYAGTAGGASVALAIVAAYLLSVPIGLARRGRLGPALHPGYDHS